MEGLHFDYCGIDIAKRNHEVSVIDAEGKPLFESISIANTQESCDKLFVLFKHHQIGISSSPSLEKTGRMRQYRRKRLERQELGMLGVKRNAVRLEPYNEQWETLFVETRSELLTLLGDDVVDVQHIGSTAIKGIVAKPILDVAVILNEPKTINFDAMAECGYIYGGEAGVPSRYYFAKYRDKDLSTHHIHCYKPDNQNFLDNIAFRDYLLNHSDYASQYNDLKLRLAQAYPDDRVKYTNEKTEFIKMILHLARIST